MAELNEHGIEEGIMLHTKGHYPIGTRVVVQMYLTKEHWYEVEKNDVSYGKVAGYDEQHLQIQLDNGELVHVHYHNRVASVGESFIH